MRNAEWCSGGGFPMWQGLTRPQELRATFGASHVARAWSTASRRRHRWNMKSWGPYRQSEMSQAEAHYL
jgi:hypothetical protein